MAISMHRCKRLLLVAGIQIALLLFLRPDFVMAQSGISYELEFSTFIGGYDFDRAQGVYVDDNGYIYIGGNTSSSNFPATSGAYDTSINDLSGRQDGFVAKISPDGTQLIWATFLGGSGRDQVYGVRADNNGNVYAVGGTSSPNFPTTSGAYDEQYSGIDNDTEMHDVFVTKISADGSSLLFSTFVGGSGKDQCRGNMFIDDDGGLYFAGETTSWDFPTTTGSGHAGGGDAFVTKVSADGSQIMYSRVIGGSGNDMAYSGVAKAPDGSVIIAGGTTSDDLATYNAYQANYQGGEGWNWYEGDGLVAKLSADLSTIHYLTYLGGSNADYVIHNQGVTVDNLGRAIVIGDTRSSNFPTTNGAFDQSINGGYNDGFVSILSPTGDLVASTFIGGSGTEEVSGVAVIQNGAIMISGNTGSDDYPTTTGVSYHGGTTDVMFSVLSADLSNLLYSTLFGGGGFSGLGERGRGVWLDAAENIVISGDTDSSGNFPVTNGSYDPSYNGGEKDGFVVKFVQSSLTSPSPSPNYGIADINTDGIVDISDYAILASEYLQTGSGLSADLNSDSLVDISDYAILAANYLL